jgi:hypothetical protein
LFERSPAVGDDVPFCSGDGREFRCNRIAARAVALIPPSSLVRRLLWFVGLSLAGVLAVAAAAEIIKVWMGH